MRIPLSTNYTFATTKKKEKTSQGAYIQDFSLLLMVVRTESKVSYLIQQFASNYFTRTYMVEEKNLLSQDAL